MPQETIKQILMRRDNLTEQEADKRIQEVKSDLCDLVMTGSLEEAEDLVMDELGLEPDHLEELLFSLA